MYLLEGVVYHLAEGGEDWATMMGCDIVADGGWDNN